jgi:hypothetical protein
MGTPWLDRKPRGGRVIGPWSKTTAYQRVAAEPTILWRRSARLAQAAPDEFFAGDAGTLMVRFGDDREADRVGTDGHWDLDWR